VRLLALVFDVGNPIIFSRDVHCNCLIGIENYHQIFDIFALVNSLIGIHWNFSSICEVLLILFICEYILWEFYQSGRMSEDGGSGVFDEEVRIAGVRPQ
jgi:hypothetical protein